MFKVMVVDNEAILRKGILCLINWKSLDCEVVYEAIDGIDAVEHLKNSIIDIVVTDIRMPEMDGIELAKFIYENYPHIKVIILTAYPDFSYAYSAITYNVVDFVIKTGYVEKLPNALQKAISLLKEQADKESKLKLLEETLNKTQNELFENFIKDVMNGIVVNNEQIDSRFKEYEFLLQNYFVISYEIVPSTYEKVHLNSPEEQNRFILAVKNFLSLAFKDFHYATVIMNKSQLLTIITFNSSDYFACSQSLLLTCSEILSMVKGFMKFETNIGISGMHHSVSELIAAYNGSLEALSGNFYSDNHLSMYLPDLGIQTGPSNTAIHQYIDDIIEFIKQHKPDEARDKLSQLFEVFKASKFQIEKVITSSMLLYSLCLRLVANLIVLQNDLMKKETDIYKEIQQSKSLKGLFEILSNVINKVVEHICISDIEHNHLVKKVNQYIKNNYTYPINLQSLADSLYVNSSYLSSLYKKETGNTIIDVLNKHRIEVAKKLLMNSSVKVYEVGLSVGIEDPKYFTHVFTKYVGVSPKQYKDSLIS